MEVVGSVAFAVRIELIGYNEQVDRVDFDAKDVIVGNVVMHVDGDEVRMKEMVFSVERWEQKLVITDSKHTPEMESESDFDAVRGNWESGND